MKHVWRPTGQDKGGCVDPPTLRERCEVCGTLCWHYTGIQSVRFRSARDKIGVVTVEDMRTPGALVEETEECGGVLLSPEAALHIPNPQRPLPPDPSPDPIGFAAKPKKLRSRWSL